MELATILSLTIGTAISKAMLTTWLNNPPAIPLSIATDLLDLLRDTVMPDEQKKNAVAQIETMGQDIAAQLRPYWDSHVPNHPAIKTEAIIRAISTTLAKTPISTKLLVAQRFNPAKLTYHLNNSNPQLTEHFSQAEKSLYKGLLTQVSRHIINRVEELNGFERHVAIATWQRQDNILEIVNQIYARPHEAAIHFEAKYRPLVNAKLDKADIFGLPETYKDHIRRQSLSNAYIPLQAEVQQDLPERWKSGVSLQNDDLKFEKEFDQAFLKGVSLITEHTLRRLAQKGPILPSGSIEKIVAQSRRLVIKSDAGSGKTTLLKWLAVRAAQQDFQDPLQHLNHTIPFFIRLRERVGKEFPQPQEFPELLTPMVTDLMPQGWVHNVLDTGRALVLIDGIDELPRKQRPAMLDRLTQLLQTYPKPRYIITSRPPAIKTEDWPEWDEWTRQEAFDLITLQPMSLTETDTFIEQWHTALAHVTTVSAADQIDLPTNLKQIIHRRPALARLATSPLLCAMICALHYERGGQNMPAERIKLYNDCVEMFLEKRDEAQGIPVEITLGYDGKLEFIRHIAYWMMRNDHTEVSIAEVDACFTRHLENTVYSGLTGPKIRQFFIERTNLLREPITGRIDFTHRTFQEFLTAQAIFDNDDFGFLLKQVRDDQWRETIILTSGYAGTRRKTDRTKFLKDIISCGNGFETKEDRHLVHLLALACLEGQAGLEKEAQDYILAQVTAIFPPKDKDAAKLIALAGNPAIPLLRVTAEQDETEAAMSVRALGFIGTPEALVALTAYASQDNIQASVSEELWLAREHFNFQTYLTKVLALLPRLILQVNEDEDDVSYLLGLDQLTHLSALVMVHILPLSNLDLLRSLHNLVTLGLLLCKNVTDLTPLKDLPQLTELHVSDTEITDLTPLKDLPQLTELNVFGTKITDLTPLKDLPQLTELDVGDTEITDLTPLKDLPQLTELDVSYTEVTDLTPLKDLPQLTTLTIDVEPLATWISLTELTQLTHLTVNISSEAHDILHKNNSHFRIEDFRIEEWLRAKHPAFTTWVFENFATSKEAKFSISWER